MQSSPSLRAAGKHERCERGHFAVHGVDFLLEPPNLCIPKPQRGVGKGLAAIGHAKIGPKVEKVVLNPGEHSCDHLLIAWQQQSCHAYGGIRLVYCTISCNTAARLQNALAASERSRAVIASLRVDFRENDHLPRPAKTSCQAAAYHIYQRYPSLTPAFVRPRFGLQRPPLDMWSTVANSRQSADSEKPREADSLKLTVQPYEASPGVSRGPSWAAPPNDPSTKARSVSFASQVKPQ